MFDDFNDDFGPVCEVTIEAGRRGGFGFLAMAKGRAKPKKAAKKKAKPKPMGKGKKC